MKTQPRLKKSNPETADVLKHLVDSLGEQWRCYRKGLKRCQKKFSSKAVHDSRIATRRLLSTIELLGVFTPSRLPKKTSEALKDYLDSFSELRDTHVQLAQVSKMAEHFAVARVFRKWLEKRESRFTRQTRKAIKRTKTKRVGKNISELEAEIRRRGRATTHAETFAKARHSLFLAFGRVMRLRRSASADDTKTIHRTRIAFKRFRYMAEVLSPLLPGVTGKLQRAMREHQAMMGDVQDAEILLKTFDEFIRRKRMDNPATRRLRVELARQLGRLIQNYLDAADKLENFQPSLILAGGQSAD